MSHVIACIDGTDVSSAVCDYAAWAALRLNAPLQFLHVLEKALYPATSDFSGNIGLGSRETLLNELAALDEKRGKIALEQGKFMLEAAKKRAIADGIATPVTRQRHGSLVETLAEMADDIRLLVLGKHDEHLSDHIGSRLENVVRTQHRPTLTAPAVFKVPRRIMFAFDRSTTTCKGIETIAASPLFRGLPCHVVMVGAENSANREHLSWAGTTLKAVGFNAPTALISGEVEHVLCTYCAEQDIDMLIMGAYGHSVIRRFFVGSTTTAIIRDARVPVLLLR